MDIKVYGIPDKTLCNQIEFIYNRFDLWDNVAFYDLWRCDDENGETHYFEVCFWEKDRVCWVGLYLVPVTFAAANKIMETLFKAYPSVRMIKYISALNALGSYWTHCDRIFIFPHTPEELDLRLTKKSRYNLRRQLKLLYCDYEDVRFEHFAAETEEGIEIAGEFIYLKRCTHGTVYRITPLEYIRKFHVTDTYCIRVNGKIASLILSCEQCGVLYMDNISYDVQYARYSPGMLLYNHYLKEMLKKYRIMFLGDGEYEYKEKYDTVKFPVYNGTVYRSTIWEWKLKKLPELKNRYRKKIADKYSNTWWYKILRSLKHKLRL